MDDDQKTRTMSTVRNIVNGGIDDDVAYGRLQTLFISESARTRQFRRMMEIVTDWRDGMGAETMYERLQTLFSETS